MRYLKWMYSFYILLPPNIILITIIICSLCTSGLASFLHDNLLLWSYYTNINSKHVYCQLHEISRELFFVIILWELLALQQMLQGSFRLHNCGVHQFCCVGSRRRCRDSCENRTHGSNIRVGNDFTQLIIAGIQHKLTTLSNTRRRLRNCS